MKICKFCTNIIPNKYANRIACCITPCVSSLIKPRTIEWRIKVLGLDEQLVLEKNKARLEKTGITRKELGLSKGDNNPNSKARLLKSGISEDIINEKHRATAKKSTLTKKNNNFYADKSNNPYSIDFWIKKGLTPEEATIKIKSKNHNCQEYWEAKGFDSEEAKVLSSKSADTNSLEAKIKRYGENGIKKYREMTIKMSNSWSEASTSSIHFSSSKSANSFFKKLYRHCRRLGFNRDQMTFKLNYGKEFWLRNDERIYFYDFVLHPLRLIIEFNGEHVHVNPALSLLERKEWKHAYSKKTAEEVENYDLDKKKLALNRGYKVFYVWSKTANSDFSTILDLIKDILNDQKLDKNQS